MIEGNTTVQRQLLDSTSSHLRDREPACRARALVGVQQPRFPSGVSPACGALALWARELGVCQSLRLGRAQNPGQPLSAHSSVTQKPESRNEPLSIS